MLICCSSTHHPAQSCTRSTANTASTHRSATRRTPRSAANATSTAASTHRPAPGYITSTANAASIAASTHQPAPGCSWTGSTAAASTCHSATGRTRSTANVASTRLPAPGCSWTRSTPHRPPLRVNPSSSTRLRHHVMQPTPLQPIVQHQAAAPRQQPTLHRALHKPVALRKAGPCQQPELAEASAHKDVTLDDVIASPKDKPLTQQEGKALGVLLKRLSAEIGSTVGLPVYTGVDQPVFPSRQCHLEEAAQHSTQEKSCASSASCAPR